MSIESQKTVAANPLVQAQVRHKTGKERLKEISLLKQVKANQPGRPSREMMIQQVMKTHGVTRAKAKTIVKGFDRFVLGQAIGQMQQAELESRAAVPPSFIQLQEQVAQQPSKVASSLNPPVFS